MDGVTVLLILGVLFLVGRGLIPNPFNTSSNVNVPSTGGTNPSAQFTLLQQGPGPQNLPAISAQNQLAGPVAKPSSWQTGCGLPSPSLPFNPVAMVSSVPSTTPVTPVANRSRTTFTTY
jgi:hypothetical protein